MAKATEAIFLRVSVDDARTLRKAAKALRIPLARFVREQALIRAAMLLTKESEPVTQDA